MTPQFGSDPSMLETANHRFRMAGQFADSAKRSDFTERPELFVFAANAHHAIELYLKAYLLVYGLSDDELRCEFGHDVSSLARECMTRGLTVSADDRATIDSLAAFRKAELRRDPMERGRRPEQPPNAKAVVSLIDRLRDAIGPYLSPQRP